MASPTFGELLRKYREHVGYTQAELAQMMGVTLMTVHRYETGARTDPPLSLVIAAAKALDKSVADFIPADDSDE